MDKKRQGVNNKRKGSNAEREFAQIFRDLGFSFCKTTRKSSRMLDDAGIDLNFIPFNVQVKAGFHKGLNPKKVLGIIDKRLPELFPPEDPVHQKTNILIHKNQIGRGHKRHELDTLVYLDKDDFMRLTERANIIPRTTEKKGNKRGWTEKSLMDNLGYKHISTVLVLYHKKNNKRGKYSTLAILSFEHFKNIIKNIEWQ